MIRLVRPVERQTQVLSLLGREGGELDVELRAMGTRYFFVERFGKHAVARRISPIFRKITSRNSLYAKRVRFGIIPQGDLSHNLVGKRTGHD